ncbi:heparin lyase I family protein [Sphingomonas morindae]|uniref:Heparin lyase I family protein n=1 Tax=Sphingomonas morindae TaxID=1541170 RepID=A0ABY4X6F6_9SPHN|nr:heparin lyase I family protein [Sphingomonas morindae]USI72459.1 heparin lyase I family protein [Sphingomonas morindae]
MTLITPDDPSGYTLVGAQQSWSWSATDSSTFRFEVRPGDEVAYRGGLADESQISVAMPAANGIPTHIGFDLTVEPGDPNDASYLVLGELAQTASDGSVLPPPYEIGLVGDQLVIYARYIDSSGTLRAAQVYTDVNNLVRGQSYHIDITAVLDPGGNGRLVVTRDGQVVADYAGALGYTDVATSNWEEGIRRATNANTTIAADFGHTSIDMGDSVQLPATQTTFIPAPTLRINTITVADAANDLYTVKLYGAGVWRAPVSIYSNGQLIGTTTADATGNYALSVQVSGDGLHNIFAVSDDGSGRIPSASYPATFTIESASDPDVNTVGNHLVEIAGETYWVQNALKSYSLTQPEPGVMRFEVHPRDVYLWDFQNNHATTRSELWGQKVYNDGTPIQINYSLMIEPGDKNTSAFLVLGQLHQDNDSVTAGGEPDFALGMTGEHMTVTLNGTDANGKAVTKVLWTDPDAIVRGQYYNIQIQVVMDPSGNGRLVVTRDGVTLVDYTGYTGYATEKGVYWKEGIYRDYKAQETIAANFKDLVVTSGSDVTFPDKADFIPAPVLAVSAVQLTGDNVWTTVVNGTGKAGTLVTLKENGSVIGSVTIGDDGSFQTVVTMTGTGTHAISAVATDGTGRSGPASNYMRMEIGTASDIVARMDAIADAGGIGAVVLTDTHALPVASISQMNTLINRDASVLAKVQGGYNFALTTLSTSTAYDTQVETYDPTGTLVDRSRFLHGTKMYEQTFSGQTSVATTWAADGSYNQVTTVAGKTLLTQSFDSGGHLTSEVVTMPDGGREVDTYNVKTGLISKATVSRVDGQRIDVTYGVTNQNYVTQANVIIGGKTVMTGRYDASNRLVLAIDAVSGYTGASTYDPVSGILATYKLIAPDGTFSVSTYGADGRTVTGTNYYTSRGVLLSSDTRPPALIVDGITKTINLAAGLAPSLAIASITANAATSDYSVLLGGFGQVGSTMALLDNGAVIAAGKVDATGHGGFLLTGLSAGVHSLQAIGTDGAGNSLVGAATIDIAVGTTAAIVGQLDALAADSALTTIMISDPRPIALTSMADLARYLSYSAVFAKAQSQTLFSLTESVTAGKGYDQQVRLFDLGGQMVLLERYAAGFQTLAQTFHGDLSVTSFMATDGSYGSSYTIAGKSVGSVNYDATSHMIALQERFADGWSHRDTIDPLTGKMTGSIVYQPDNSRLEWTMVTGRDYAQQVTSRDATGKILFTARYDAAGHIVQFSDTSVGGATTLQYGSSGVLASDKVMAADGSYSVTSFAADGATVTGTNYYSAKGVLLSSDLQDPGHARLVAISSAVAMASGHAHTSGVLIGTNADDTLTATSAATLLVGGTGTDVLIGGAGNDLIIGGPGADIMTGGGGKNVFWFGPGDIAATSATTGADRITDFGQGDRIDLSTMENLVAGRVGFHFIGASAFDGVAGAVHLYETGGNTFIQGDLNGDKVADFTIQLDGHHVLKATDFFF